MGVIITNVALTKNPVKTEEQLKISVSIKEITDDPKMYRLPFVLGQKKGGVK